MKKYVVKPGDTMVQISAKTGVRVPLLIASNPQIQNPNDLVPGQTMIIPELGKKTKTGVKSAAGKTWPKSMPLAPYFGFVWPHVVQPGESFESIAQQYHVTVEQVYHVNPQATKGPLQPGTMMYIPATSGKFKQPVSASAMTTPSVPMAPGAVAQVEGGTGPNTHHPFRESTRPMSGMPNITMEVPRGWYADADESSELFSSWDAWDDAASGQWRSVADAGSQRVQAADAEEGGWSQTWTVHLDGGE